MSYRISLGAGLVLTAAVVIWIAYPLFWDSPSEYAEYPLSNYHPAYRAAIGSEEDPGARLEWEWMRLHDPSSGVIPANIQQRELAFAEGLPSRAGKGAQTSSWSIRGPVNVGGRTRALARDVTDATGNTLLAGGVSGGIYRSTDAGATWTNVSGTINRPSITDIVQDTRAGETSTWYATAGEGVGNSSSGNGSPYRGHGMYRSLDGGLTWAVIPTTQTGSQTTFDSYFDYVSEVALDPANTTDDVVYVAAGGNILRSDDGMTTFTEVLSRTPPATGRISTAPADVLLTTVGAEVVTSFVFAAIHGSGSGGGVFCSTTGLAGSWTNITPAFFPSAGTYGRIELGVNGSGNEIWAFASTPGAGTSNHMLGRRSAVNAVDLCASGTWTDFTSQLPNRGGSTGSINSQGGYDLYVTVQPTDDDVVILGGVSLWRLDITGAATATNTWIGGYDPDQAVSNPFARYPNHHPDQHAYAWHPSNANEFISADDGGLQRTADVTAAGDGGVAWTDLNNGYYTTQFYHVCYNPDDSDPTVAGGLQDNGTWASTSTTITDPWAEIGSGDGADCAIRNNTAQTTIGGVSRYSSSQNGNVFRRVYSSNTDTSLDDIANVTPSAATGQLFITPFVVVDEGLHRMFYPAGTALWRNEDLEDIPMFVEDGVGADAFDETTVNWTNMTGSNVGASITALQFGETALFFGAADGSIRRLDNALSAAAATAPANITPPGASGFPNGIAINAKDENEVLVAYSSYNVVSLYHTSDALAVTPTWTDVEGNLSGADGPSVRDVAIMPNVLPGPVTRYYAATSVGLYSTDMLQDVSTTWALESDIGNVVVDDVDARATDGLVVAGTHGRGVYTSNLSVDFNLPVELAAFAATVDDGTVALTWETASETNNAGFGVEMQRRGDDRAGFVEAGYVTGVGTTDLTSSYRYVVEDLAPGDYAFRLRQVDYDGATTYSGEVEVSVLLETPFRFSAPYPNPARDRLTLEVAVQRTQHLTVAVYDMTGRRVGMIHDGSIAEQTTVPLTFDASQLAAGTYMVRAVGESVQGTHPFTVVR